jgi:glycosyltransferase involved in cell wall biosynthesis
MTKIYYVGDKFSSFVDRDIKTLREAYNVRVVKLELNNRNYKDIILKAFQELFMTVPDIYFILGANGHAMIWLIIAMLNRRPAIVEVLGYEVCKMPEYNYGLQLKTIRGYIVRWVLRHANCVLSPSDFYTNRILSVVPDAKVTTVYNYADEPESINYNKQLQAIMVARVDGINADIKGLDLYQQFAYTHPAINFYCVGLYDEHAKKMAPNVIFLGELPHNEVLELLNNSKIYCQTSHVESFGVACLEALQRGCLIVSTLSEGMRDVVGDVNMELATAMWRNDRKLMEASIEQSKKFTRERWLARVADVITAIKHK